MQASLTLTPAEVSVVLVEQAVTKHNTRYDKTFAKAVSHLLRLSASFVSSHHQFLAGVMLSFGGLFDLILAGGSPALSSANPGIVKVLAGFVFPVGLVM